MSNGTPDFSLYSGAAIVGGVPVVPAVTGSANGDPRSNGFIANLSWWPVQNIGLTCQYTGYTRFNGAATNYDGNGTKCQFKQHALFSGAIRFLGFQKAIAGTWIFNKASIGWPGSGPRSQPGSPHFFAGRSLLSVGTARRSTMK